MSHGPTTVLCYGDSNTHGWDPATQQRMPAGRRWPGVLRSELGAGFEVIEEGLNGRTTAIDDPFSEHRNGSVYLLPCLWSHAPLDVVVLMLGTNDLKSTFRLDPADIARGAGLLVDLTKRSLSGPGQTPPLILLVAPPPIGPAEAIAESSGLAAGSPASRVLARLYQEVAEERGVGFMDAGRFVAASPLDGIHLDQPAHLALGRAVADRIRSQLGDRVPQ